MAAAPVNLGTSSTFGVLAGTGINNTATATAVVGKVGVWPAFVATIINFPPGTATGGIHGADTDALSVAAQVDLTNAYTTAAGFPGGVDPTGGTGELGGLVLTPGIYKFTEFHISAALTLTLNGKGDYIFQSGSTFTTGAAAIVTLTGGAQANRVFFQVSSSATLGATTAFKGNILALTNITAGNGATVSGRLLARNGVINLDNNAITEVMHRITVNYTPQTTGNHRICYRQNSPVLDAAFCCMLDTTPSTPGTPKIFILMDVGVTPCDTCGPVSPVGVAAGNYVYEGYVQPSCAASTCSSGDADVTLWAANVTFVVV